MEKWKKRKAFSVAELNEIIAATRERFAPDGDSAQKPLPRVEDFWRGKIELEENAAGTFFNSEKIGKNEPHPCDAAANGAYHIALKGLMLVREGFWKKSSEEKSGDGGPLANPKWFKFVQNREFGRRGNVPA